jgi:hypothetical protein
VEALVERIPPPRSVLEALNRHATVARVGDLVRTDTKVSWWSGSASYRGEAPAKRLFAWKELRRVRSDVSTVALADLPDGVSALRKDAWLSALGSWLARSPLTDIATMLRASPAFQWSQPTLAFVATPLGVRLAARALSHCASGSPDALRSVPSALESSIHNMPAGKARDIALAFSQEAAARIKGSLQTVEPAAAHVKS